MSEKDNTILESINQILDKTDPVQKAIALLASLIDIRMRQFSNENSEQHTHLIDKINEVVKEQEGYEERLQDLTHINSCPMNNDVKLEELKKQLQPYLFITNYPKLAILMLIGVLALCGLGVDKIYELFK